MRCPLIRRGAPCADKNDRKSDMSWLERQAGPPKGILRLDLIPDKHVSDDGTRGIAGFNQLFCSFGLIAAGFRGTQWRHSPLHNTVPTVQILESFQPTESGGGTFRLTAFALRPDRFRPSECPPGNRCSGVARGDCDDKRQTIVPSSVSAMRGSKDSSGPSFGHFLSALRYTEGSKRSGRTCLRIRF